MQDAPRSVSHAFPTVRPVAELPPPLRRPLVHAECGCRSRLPDQHHAQGESLSSPSPSPASRCSISFASATELPFQPAPLLRAPAPPPPPTTGGPPPTHLPPANEAFKANYLGFLIRHRRHALKGVRPGDFGLFLVAAVCRLWQRLPQRHSARRRLPMPEQEGNLQLGG